jgi:hypothetical protein
MFLEVILGANKIVVVGFFGGGGVIKVFYFCKENVQYVMWKGLQKFIEREIIQTFKKNVWAYLRSVLNVKAKRCSDNGSCSLVDKYRSFKEIFHHDY